MILSAKLAIILESKRARASEQERASQMHFWNNHTQERQISIWLLLFSTWTIHLLLEYFWRNLKILCFLYHNKKHYGLLLLVRFSAYSQLCANDRFLTHTVQPIFLFTCKQTRYTKITTTHEKLLLFFFFLEMKKCINFL